MEEKKERFEVLSIGEMRRKYYAPNEVPPRIQLDAQRVPEALRVLIPLAEKWGISDDILRGDAADNASPDEVAEFRRIVQQYEDLLMEWLAGPDAEMPELSKEYLAFTNML